jgi:nitrate/nitrite transporter NarK
MGMPQAIAMTFIANTYPERITGTVGGLTMGIGIFGGAIGVGVGSTALAVTKMYNASITIVFIVCIVGAIAAFGMNPPRVFEKKDISC